MSNRRRGLSTAIVITAIVLVSVIGVGAVYLGTASGSDKRAAGTDEFVVRRGSFDISVPASGELAALNQIEIRNKLESRAVLTEIVAEGTFVKQGDVLFRFAEDELDDNIQDARDALNSAVAAAASSEANLRIKQSEQASAIDKAELSVQLADLALKAWAEGQDVSRKSDIELEIETADKDYQRLKDKYEESKKLRDQQFISQDDFRSDEINMIRARARLDQAKLSKTVYHEYERPQQEKQKISDVDQAKAELDRVKQRHKAELDRAQSDLEAHVAARRSKQDRLDDLVEQLEYCTVLAPSAGLVVYSTSLEENRWSRGDRGDLQVGAEIRKNELVIVLPDTTQMTAELKVNESLTGLIEAGQRAVIKSDVIPDRALECEVHSIGVLAESGGWRDPNRRDYTVTVKLLDGNDLGLKPSMRCKAEIFVGKVTDALYVPVQAIFHEGATAYVYVPRGAGYAQSPVEIGAASGLYVEVTSGLAEGDIVLLREPAQSTIASRLDKGGDENPAQGHRPGRGEVAQRGNRAASAGG